MQVFIFRICLLKPSLTYNYEFLKCISINCTQNFTYSLEYGMNREDLWEW